MVAFRRFSHSVWKSGKCRLAVWLEGQKLHYAVRAKVREVSLGHLAMNIWFPSSRLGTHSNYAKGAALQLRREIALAVRPGGVAWCCAAALFYLANPGRPARAIGGI